MNGKFVAELFTILSVVFLAMAAFGATLSDFNLVALGLAAYASGDLAKKIFSS